jgi:hypothetical protein
VARAWRRLPSEGSKTPNRETPRIKEPVIAQCTCVHPAQDALHGPGWRVFNLKRKPLAHLQCTVCKAKRYTGLPKG